ncbi:hypothetical protein M728_005569 (plasmid) [Ensifer sp. WSM1721]|uniref:hypothetical protein n=1 Tax=Ensifer sp. WSM1721 TaxID=1041159 RepID=UPI00055872D5|nr:hypothetical protein [Ensifer sp. WSM1721]
MKTPQRNFVVEFKAGRRRPKERTNSIWGDTDLKALAREVEESHLLSLGEAPAASEASKNSTPDRINGGSASECDGDGVVAPAAAIPSTDGAQPDNQHDAHRPEFEAVTQMPESQPVSGPTTSRGAVGKRAHFARVQAMHESMRTHEDQSQRSNAPGGLLFVDEVAALDMENRRLKRRLAERLCAENLKLKKMLERFGLT